MNGVLERHRSALRDATFAFSLANLCFIWAYFDLVYEAYDYHCRLPVTNAMLLALMANVGVVTFLIWGAARLVRRSSNRLVVLGAVVALFGAWLVPLNFFRVHAGLRLSLWGASISPVVPRFVVAGLLLLVAGSILLWPRRAGRLAYLLTLLMVWLGLLLFGKTCCQLFKAKPGFPPVTLAPVLTSHRASAGPGRVVWILFDAFDQRMAFSARPPGVALPEFDRLLGEAVVATNAHPPAASTLLSIPAMTTGRYVLNTQRSNCNELGLVFSGATTPLPWTGSSDVFSMAHAMGRNVALGGWYHPYDRLFGRVACTTFMPRCLFAGVTRAESFPESVVNQLFSIVTPIQARWQHRQRHEEGLAGVLKAVADSNLDLVFWHAVVPHYPAIYDPVSNRRTVFRFAGFGDYTGNLALADQTMGQVRRSMESARLWGESWVLVSSDHFWNSAEAYFGSRDTRVPFLLKPPGTNSPVTHGGFVNTVVSRDLVLAILRGEIRTGAEVATWLDAHPTPPAPYHLMGQED
jgi:hypothetical protein